MRFIKAITPVGCLTDLTVSELRELHRAIGLPWWSFLAPPWVVKRLIKRLADMNGEQGCEEADETIA